MYFNKNYLKFLIFWDSASTHVTSYPGWSKNTLKGINWANYYINLLSICS